MTEPVGYDLRHLLFGDSEWFQDLEEESDDLWVLWRITRSAQQAWWRELLTAAACFASRHGLIQLYRQRFAGIPVPSMRDSVGEAENRNPLAPIWEIASELIVGLVLESTLGWTLLAHEPPGHRDRIGDWLFETPAGKPVFVEVKTLEEPVRYPSVFAREPATDRLTNVLKGAYRQLPRDERATLVVVVGIGVSLILGTPHGIYHSDIFQTLFGRLQVRFPVLPYNEELQEMGPAFRDMFAHAGKHRRMGVVGGLILGGLDTPGVGFYVVHNPFADDACSLTPDDFPQVSQYWVDAVGVGDEISGMAGGERWQTILDACRA